MHNTNSMLSMEIPIKKTCKPVIMTKEELIWVLSNYFVSPLLRFLVYEDVEPSRLQNVLGKCIVCLMIPNYLPVKNSSFHCNFLPNSPAVFLWDCVLFQVIARSFWWRNPKGKKKKTFQLQGLEFHSSTENPSKCFCLQQCF